MALDTAKTPVKALPSLPDALLRTFLDQSIALWNSFDQISKANPAPAAHAQPSVRAPAPHEQAAPRKPQGQISVRFDNAPAGTRISTRASGTAFQLDAGRDDAGSALWGTSFSHEPPPAAAAAVSASASRSSSGPSSAPAGLHFDKARSGWVDPDGKLAVVSRKDGYTTEITPEGRKKLQGAVAPSEPVQEQKGPVTVVSHFDGHKTEFTVDRALFKNDYTTTVTKDPQALKNLQRSVLPVRDPSGPVVIVNRIDGTVIKVDREKFKKGDFSTDPADQVPPEDQWGPPDAEGIRKPSFHQMQEDFVLFRSKATRTFLHAPDDDNPPSAGDAIDEFHSSPTGKYFLSFPSLFKERRDFDKYEYNVAFVPWSGLNGTTDTEEEALFRDVGYGDFYVPPNKRKQ